jgi:hypothetical protein
MKRGILGLAVGLLLTVGADQAGAATTFGADLATPAEARIGNGSTTTVTRAIPTGHAAPGGAVAPIDGVVVRWRIRTLANTSLAPGQSWQAQFRLAHGNHSVGTSAPVQVGDVDGVQNFDTRLPVHAGDALGLDTPGGEGNGVVSSGISDFYQPSLGASETRSPTSPDATYYLNVNADIEPDVDGDGYGDETQDLCPADASKQGDCTPPDTTITVQPAAKTSSTQARFEFTSETGATFDCSFDGSGFTSCISPVLKALGVGSHVFQVRAVDAAGNADQSPAVASWEITKAKKKHKHHHKHHHGHGHHHGHV